AVVQPGVVNLHLSTATAPYGLHFVPDPSSQKACTLGGNVAENSGGPHTLAYGVTTNHVTGLEIVLSDGSVVRLGGKAIEDEGYPLDAGGILLVEVDGARDGLDEQLARIERICRSHQATTIRLATTAIERERLWAGRKGAFAAMGRLSPDYYVQDGVIPRTRL